MRSGYLCKCVTILTAHNPAAMSVRRALGPLLARARREAEHVYMSPRHRGTRAIACFVVALMVTVDVGKELLWAVQSHVDGPFYLDRGRHVPRDFSAGNASAACALFGLSSACALPTRTAVLRLRHAGAGVAADTPAVSVVLIDDADAYALQQSLGRLLEQVQMTHAPCRRARLRVWPIDHASAHAQTFQSFECVVTLPPDRTAPSAGALNLDARFRVRPLDTLAAMADNLRGEV
jgi:hypothetical protein